MSYTTVWKVYKTKAVSYKELHNGHGSAPPIWSWFCEYAGKNSHAWLLSENISWLWELYKDQNVPLCMRFALLATFDNGVVFKEDFAKAAELAMQAYETIRYPDRVNHWGSISLIYQELADIKDYRLIGIGIGCTSVNDPWEFDFKNREPFDILETLGLKETKYG